MRNLGCLLFLSACGVPVPTDTADTAGEWPLLGSVFVQGGEGVGSYHFDGLDDVYISYSQAPEAWTLDDGSPLPAVKPFLEPVFDEGLRMFRGKVDWSTPERSTVDGAERCEYRMVFNVDYTAIMWGNIRYFDPAGEPLGESSYTTSLAYTRLE